MDLFNKSQLSKLEKITSKNRREMDDFIRDQSKEFKNFEEEVRALAFGRFISSSLTYFFSLSFFPFLHKVGETKQERDVLPSLRPKEGDQGEGERPQGKAKRYSKG